MKTAKQTQSSSPLTAIMAGLALTAASPAFAIDLFSEDFETPVVTGYSQGTTPPTKWVRAAQGYRSNYHGLINEDVDTTPGVGFEDPVGAQAYAFRYTNSGLTSAAGVVGTLQLGVTYLVSVDVVKDISGTGLPYTIQLIAFAPGAARDDCRATPAGSYVLSSKGGDATDDGVYSTVSFTFTAGCANVGVAGYDLGVRFRGATNSAIIDNVKVEADYSNVAFWDIDGSTAGSGGVSPSGTWDAATTNWNPLPDGADTAASWTPGRVPVFSAGADATGSYIVTVDGTQNISGLILKDGTLNLANGTSGALNLTADSDFIIAAGLSAAIGVPLTDSGTQAFEKCGAGTLVLSADNSGATGPVAVSAGVLQVESPSSLNGTELSVTINSGGTLVFGPSFGAGNIPTALLNRIADASAGTIAADHYNSTAFDFATSFKSAAYLGAVGSVNYTGTLTPAGTTYRLGGGGGTLTMANPNAVTGAGSSLVVKGNVVLAAANDHDSGTTLDAGGNLTLGNNDSLGSGTLIIAGASTVQATGTVVTTNAVTANANFTVAGTGALTLGNLTLNANRIITNNNTNATTTLGEITGTNRTLTFNGSGNTTVAGDITTGTGSLTKNNAGMLTLTGTNTYTGVTDINGGTVLVNGDSSAAGGNVTVDGASLGGTGTIGGNVTVGTTGGLKFNLGTGPGSHDKLDIATDKTLTFGAACALTITSSGGASPGLYTLVTAAGGIGTLPTFTVTLPADWTADPPVVSGNDLQLNITSTGSGASPYDTWKAQITNGLNLRTDDAEGDGYLNLEEFLFGTSPIAGNGSLVTTTTSGGNLVLRWLQRESGAAYTLKQSSTLGAGSWTTAAQSPALDGDQAGAPTDYDYYTVTLPTGGGKLFFRIEGVEN